MPRDEQGAVGLRDSQVVREERQPEARGQLQARVLLRLRGGACWRGDGVQVDGALARGSDGDGGLVEQHDAIGVGLTGDGDGVDGTVLENVHVHHGRDRQRGIRLDGPEEGALAGGEVVLVSDVELGPADSGDGVRNVDQRVDDGADVCGC